ncbi:MAG TPA: hypothetical protein VN752_03345 [Solirubrobacterales bacterium]|nr:hypothetical protein [Solirubrobacterales bacterium]
MFDTTKTSTADRAVDAVDLVIDFATLGEYGLEPVDAGSKPCEARRRSGTVRSSGAWNAAIAHFAPQHS